MEVLGNAAMLNLDRVLLILMDYPKFDQGDYKDIRISAFEIYPKEERCKVFCELIKNHYFNIYIPKITGKLKKGLTKGNPMNLHPFGIQFYKCNPILTFCCIVKDIDTSPQILIEEKNYVSPKQDRPTTHQSLLMPSSLLKDDEWDVMIEAADYNNEVRPLMKVEMTKDFFIRLKKKDKCLYLPLIDETLRSYIPLRDIVAVIQKEHYQR